MKSKDLTQTKVLQALLKKYYKDAHCALNFSNARELLIATILSAQCTDERVNLVTQKLFIQYPNWQSYADTSLTDLEQTIRSTGFYKNKAKNIKACAQKIINEYHGDVPRKMADLVKLPGVGRKTANVVLGNAFGIASGIVVDTHVGRLSQRMGFTKQKTPEKIELDLMEIVPKSNWVHFSHEMIMHGRKLCKARKPSCQVCFMQDICPKRI